MLILKNEPLLTHDPNVVGVAAPYTFQAVARWAVPLVPLCAIPFKDVALWTHRPGAVRGACPDIPKELGTARELLLGPLGAVPLAHPPHFSNAPDVVRVSSPNFREEVAI